MMRPIGFALACMSLAACGQTDVKNEKTASAGPAATAGYTDVQHRVLALAQPLRHGVFLRAIRDGAAPCQQLVEDIRQPDLAGSPLWAVRCSDDERYAIAIDAKGMAQVTRIPSGRR